MFKRLKNLNGEHSIIDCEMSLDEKNLSSDIDRAIQATTIPPSYPYHTSVCGSLLFTPPSNIPAEIFSFIRHANFDAFKRSFDLHYNEIIGMKNDHGQTVLHLLVIHAYPYVWVRLLMMRGIDMCAQDLDGYTPAHYAVERDDVEMLKALTMRFHCQARPIPEERIVAIHEQCLKALSVRNHQGLTVFMLACRQESLKCLNYLIELKINDCNLLDKYGDTCLHFAVARRNESLVDKLINVCEANVNGGDPMRPSARDILQYNREQLKLSDSRKDDMIEQLLISKCAAFRCTIRRITTKRKESADPDEGIVANLACITLDLTKNGQSETARSHARMGATLQAKGDLTGAKESYKQAIAYAPEGTTDWATYAFSLAIVHIVHGEGNSALALLEKALEIRKQLEHDSQEIEQIQKAINALQLKSS